jgi:hypothetical protein
MGTALVGRVGLADGSTVVVVAHEVPHRVETINVPVADVQAAQEDLRRALKSGQPWLILMGLNTDGSAYLVEGPAESAQT